MPGNIFNESWMISFVELCLFNVSFYLLNNFIDSVVRLIACVYA